MFSPFFYLCVMKFFDGMDEDGSKLVFFFIELVLLLIIIPIGMLDSYDCVGFVHRYSVHQ